MPSVTELDSYKKQIREGIQELYPTLRADSILIIPVHLPGAIKFSLILKLPSSFRPLTVFDMYKDIKTAFPITARYPGANPAEGLICGRLKVLYRGWWITFLDMGHGIPIYKIATNKRGAKHMEFVVNTFEIFSLVVHNKISPTLHNIA
jgi:hypothetical protein